MKFASNLVVISGIICFIFIVYGCGLIEDVCYDWMDNEITFLEAAGYVAAILVIGGVIIYLVMSLSFFFESKVTNKFLKERGIIYVEHCRDEFDLLSYGFSKILCNKYSWLIRPIDLLRKKIGSSWIYVGSVVLDSADSSDEFSINRGKKRRTITDENKYVVFGLFTDVPGLDANYSLVLNNTQDIVAFALEKNNLDKEVTRASKSILEMKIRCEIANKNILFLADSTAICEPELKCDILLFLKYFGEHLSSEHIRTV